MTESRICNCDYIKQPIDFKGLSIDGYIYPTDIDGIIEYKNSEYIILEAKYGKASVPKGQKLALQRMVDDFIKLGKKAVVIVFEHRIKNDTPIIAAWCKVREVYYGNNTWERIEENITVGKAVKNFQKGIKI